MSFLYVISEDDSDDLFYELCVERITGKQFAVDSRRLRRGGGIAAARRMLALILKQIKYIGPVDDTYFVVSLDNDRCRVHPEHQSPLDPNKISRLPKHERDKPCRFCELRHLVIETLGPEESWSIKGAIGVPVQMLESWLLLISNPDAYSEESQLPLFSRRTKPLAREYYRPRQPPAQLKDLREVEKARLGIEATEEYCLYCVEQLDPDDLSARSSSFSLFRAQVLAWS